LDQLKTKMAKVRIVYVGELHNHDWGHKIELLLLENLFNVKGDVAVALEMFERDIQHLMDGYLSYEVTESFFLRYSRPWKNYQPDYRPLVKFCQTFRLPVLAMNVPRRYAAYVAQGKENILAELPKYEKGFIADKIVVLKDKYYSKFYETMKGHVPPEKIELYYRAQCLKDDTMAKSIVSFMSAHPNTTVISYAGAFHSDEHLGLVSKVTLQLPSVNKLVLSIIPDEKEGSKTPEKYSHLGDFILFAPGNISKDKAEKQELLKADLKWKKTKMLSK